MEGSGIESGAGGVGLEGKVRAVDGWRRRGCGWRRWSGWVKAAVGGVGGVGRVDRWRRLHFFFLRRWMNG